jgi:hypothetical protein
VLALSVERAHVGAEEFVGRAGQEITIEGADVDGSVRGVVDGVDERERPCFVCELSDFGYRIDRAYGVWGVAHGHQLGFCSDFLFQVVEIEGAVRFVDIDLADDYAFFFQRAPGGDVGVVIKRGYYDFVTGF